MAHASWLEARRFRCQRIWWRLWVVPLRARRREHVEGSHNSWGLKFVKWSSVVVLSFEVFKTNRGNQQRNRLH
eukprot:6470912-Amphidinium_carterae.3